MNTYTVTEAALEGVRDEIKRYRCNVGKTVTRDDAIREDTLRLLGLPLAAPVEDAGIKERMCEICGQIVTVPADAPDFAMYAHIECKRHYYTQKGPTP